MPVYAAAQSGAVTTLPFSSNVNLPSKAGFPSTRTCHVFGSASSCWYTVSGKNHVCFPLGAGYVARIFLETMSVIVMGGASFTSFSFSELDLPLSMAPIRFPCFHRTTSRSREMTNTEKETSREEYIAALLADVVALVCYEDNQVRGRASGFVLQPSRTDTAYLVSVHHLFRKHKTGWHLECHVVNKSNGDLVIPAQSEAAFRSISRRETPLIPLPKPTLVSGGLEAAPKVDIAVFPLGLKRTLGEMTPELLAVGLRPDVPHFKPSCVVTLDLSECYGFGAWNQDEHHPDIKAAFRQPCYETDLAVDSVTDNVVVFRLNHNHPGHDRYYGASLNGRPPGSAGEASAV